jgi:hypothetical protein
MVDADLGHASPCSAALVFVRLTAACSNMLRRNAPANNNWGGCRFPPRGWRVVRTAPGDGPPDAGGGVWIRVRCKNRPWDGTRVWALCPRGDEFGLQWDTQPRSRFQPTDEAGGRWLRGFMDRRLGANAPNVWFPGHPRLPPRDGVDEPWRWATRADFF